MTPGVGCVLLSIILRGLCARAHLWSSDTVARYVRTLCSRHVDVRLVGWSRIAARISCEEADHKDDSHRAVVANIGGTCDVNISLGRAGVALYSPIITA